MIVKDFSKKSYEKRIAKIEGEEIDVSRIPTRVMVELAELNERKDELARNSIESFNKIVEIISLACRKNPKITPDWLKDNTDIEQLFDLMEFILEPVKRRAEDVSKNLDTPLENQNQ